MLIAVLPVTNYLSTKQALFQLADSADGVELRLDYAPHWNITEVNALRKATRLPVIFTLRNRTQGGHYPHSEAQRLQTIFALCTLLPDYLDIESMVPKAYIHALRQRYPAIKIILSYHNFIETPADLSALFASVYQEPIYAHKIATQARSTLDAVRMLQWVLSMRTQHRVIGLCMGELGHCTRILAPVVGSLFSYAYADKPQTTASGQLSLLELRSVYHYRALNAETKLYVLLGDPVDLSVGHIVHNKAIEILAQNAVYIKLCVTEQELPELLQRLRQLPLGGMSVTMPLKKTIISFLDQIDAAARVMQAVNTVVCAEQWSGLNTDGMGAMHALQAQGPLAEKIIVIFGAGGAARAIVYALLAQGARVMVFNRTLAKATALAEEFGCDAYPLELFPRLTSYHLCINTLPEKAFLDPFIQTIWHAKHILPGIVAMDIVYQPIETTFLRTAKKANCVCLPGFYMYMAQALLQIHYWFQPASQAIAEIRHFMQRYFS